MWRLLEAFLSAITRPLVPVPVPLPVSQRPDPAHPGEAMGKEADDLDS